MRNAKMVDRWLGPVAAVALGAAMAFFVFAMPVAVMESIVDAMGLGMLAPIAQSTRFGLIVTSALIVALPTWLLFRLLDRSVSPVVWDTDDGDLDWGDYPDIDDGSDLDYDRLPQMRPLSADTDVGEPLLLDTPIASEPVVTASRQSADIAALLDRLEEGLRRRPLPRRPLTYSVADDRRVTPIYPMMERPEPADDALRSALAELQRIAGQRV